MVSHKVQPRAFQFGSGMRTIHCTETELWGLDLDFLKHREAHNQCWATETVAFRLLTSKLDWLEVLSVFQLMTSLVPDTSMFRACIVNQEPRISWPNPAPCHRVPVSESRRHQAACSSLGHKTPLSANKGPKKEIRFNISLLSLQLWLRAW